MQTDAQELCLNKTLTKTGKSFIFENRWWTPKCGWKEYLKKNLTFEMGPHQWRHHPSNTNVNEIIRFIKVAVAWFDATTERQTVDWLYMLRVLAECCIVGQAGRTQWCHRLRLRLFKWDRAAIDVWQRTDSCCPPERQRDTFWTAAWCINSVFSTNVKLSTLCASLLMEHHVLSPTYRPLVSVFLYFFSCLCFYFYFLFEPPSGEEASLPSLPYCHPAFGLTIFWLFILILGK